MALLPREQTRKVNDGYDVWRWPEFIAFATRLGIELGSEMDTKGVTIRICEGEVVVITQEYNAREPKDPNLIDTTTLHNESYRTKVPRSCPAAPDEPIHGGQSGA